MLEGTIRQGVTDMLEPIRCKILACQIMPNDNPLSTSILYH